MHVSYVTLFAATLSSIITITSCGVAIYIIRYFFSPPSPEPERQNGSPTCASPTVEIETSIGPLPIGTCPSHSVISRPTKFQSNTSNSPRSPPHASINTLPSVELALPPLSPSISMQLPSNELTLDRCNTVSKSSMMRSASITRRDTDRSAKADTRDTRDISSSIRYLSSFIAVFNALNAGFNTVYCVWLVIEPGHMYDFYAHHPAHTQRLTSTISWYIAKTLFLWLLTYRLYRAFKGSVFCVNKTFLLCLNIANSIIAPVGLAIAYWAVYTQQSHWIEEVAFNFWRLLYQLIVAIVLYMFCSRLLQLVIDNKMIIMREKEIAKIDGSDRVRIQTPCKISTEFLEVITRHTLLVVTVSVTVAATTFCFFGFRFIFLPQTCVTLLIPMNMAALDSLVTSICIVFLFPMGRPLYRKVCGLPHLCLSKMCLCCARKTLV
eukprot:64184_1